MGRVGEVLGGRTVDSGPINNSKGCGGVMRAAPAGLFGLGASTSFTLGVDLAAITHGHPSGYLAAGALAAIIDLVVDGQPLPAATDIALALLREWRSQGGGEVLAALRKAIELAVSARPSPAAVESLGKGWVAEEALAIAVYCALATPEPRDALLLAVNHGGDSDSTGAITGNLVGAASGRQGLPAEWLEPLELRGIIETVADDICACTEVVLRNGQSAFDRERYVGG